jgi:hypothetical protein
MIAEIARVSQEALLEEKTGPICLPMQGWIAWRGLNDSYQWLIEHDLGALIEMTQHLPNIMTQGKELYEAWVKGKKEEQANLERSASAARGKEKVRLNNALNILIEEMSAEQNAFNHFMNHVLPSLMKPEWNGSCVYIYRDENGVHTSLNIRQFAAEGTDRKNKKVMRVQPRMGKRGLFGVQQALFDVGDGWRPEDRIPEYIVVEGEHNQLALCHASERWADDYKMHLPVVAVGGKQGADLLALKALCGDQQPLVIFDNDNIDPETGCPGGFDLVRDMAKFMYCTACSTADYYSGSTSAKDIDDLISDFWEESRTFGYSDFLEIISHRRFVRMAIETVADKVAGILTDKSIEANRKVILVGDIITEDAIKRWHLRRVGDSAVLVVIEGSRGDVIRCTPDDANFGRKMVGYGIAEARWLATIAEAFRKKVSTLPRMIIHADTFYDAKNQLLYKNVYDGTMVKIWIEGEGPSHAKPVMQRVPVGADDVLMWRFAQDADDKAAPIQPWLQAEDDPSQMHLAKAGGMRLQADSLIKKHIWDCVKYEGNAHHYRQLLQCWILFNSFATSFLSRPAVALQGPPGSTKTALMQKLGYMMQGEHFNVIQQPASGEDLAIKMNKQTIAAFDEWDTADAKIENILNAILTGAPFTKRKNYTDEEKNTIRCNAAIIMTRNSDPMRSAGSFRRTINVLLADRGDSRYRSMTLDIVPQLMGHRLALRLEELRNCAYVLLALSQTSPGTETAYSVADFGSVVMRCAQFEGWAKEAEAMLAKLMYDQSATAIENNCLVDPLDSYFALHPEQVGKTHTTGMWSELLHMAGTFDFDRTMKDRVNAKYLAWQFTTHTKVFQDRLGMLVTRDTVKCQNTYTFWPPGAVAPEDRGERIGKEPEEFTHDLSVFFGP